MTFGAVAGLGPMSNSTQNSTTVTQIGVAMFTVADQDAALAFYTGKLGYEGRSDSPFRGGGAVRWGEVAPRGPHAGLALSPPMQGQPGGGSIGVETADVTGEHERLKAIGDVDVDAELMQAPG